MLSIWTKPLLGHIYHGIRKMPVAEENKRTFYQDASLFLECKIVIIIFQVMEL